MVVHNNIYIPTESWPHWTWFAIEFFIVFATALLITKEFMTAYDGLGLNQVMQNWLFWGIFSIIFFLWYIVIRGIILKKPVLGNSVNYRNDFQIVRR